MYVRWCMYVCIACVCVSVCNVTCLLTYQVVRTVHPAVGRAVQTMTMGRAAVWLHCYSKAVAIQVVEVRFVVAAVAAVAAVVVCLCV